MPDRLNALLQMIEGVRTAALDFNITDMTAEEITDNLVENFRTGEPLQITYPIFDTTPASFSMELAEPEDTDEQIVSLTRLQ